MIEPVPAAMSSATSPETGAIARTMCTPATVLPHAQDPGPTLVTGGEGANSARAMRGGLAITGGTVPIDGGAGHTTPVVSDWQPPADDEVRGCPYFQDP